MGLAMHLPDELRLYAGEIGPALATPVLAAWDEDDTFHVAEQVEAIATVLIDRIGVHKQLLNADIAYVFREKMKTRDRVVWGKASKAGSRVEFFAGHDFVVEINWQEWRKLSDHQKVALIDHELSHFGREQDDKGEWHWVLNSHDIEEFGGVVRRWGLWRDDLKAFAGAVTHAQQLGMFDGARD